MNYKISKAAASLSPSLTLAIDAKAKAMKAAGEDVVGFGAGEPDFDTPQHIKDAAAKALAAGFTKYTPSSGIPELREAIAEKFKRENGLTYKPSQVIVSCGGKHSCFNVIMATCEAGDEVIIPAPYWLSYPEMVKLAGAKPVVLETSDKTEFKVTPQQLRAAITPNTRLFILNSPSNPTGSVYSPEEVKALGDICVEKNLLIMSDEIYEHLLYDNAKVRSVAAFSPEHQARTIIVHGFAKAWSMTGWRLGFLAAPEPIARAIDAVQSHSTSNPTSFAQKGGVAALTGPQDHLPKWLAEYRPAPPLRAPEVEFHSRNFLRERQGRVLSVPEYFRDQAQVVRFLRETSGGGESRRCARHRVRRGRLLSFELCHQHGKHPKGIGADRAVLSEFGVIYSQFARAASNCGPFCCQIVNKNVNKSSRYRHMAVTRMK